MYFLWISTHHCIRHQAVSQIVNWLEISWQKKLLKYPILMSKQAEAEVVPSSSLDKVRLK